MPFLMSWPGKVPAGEGVTRTSTETARYNLEGILTKLEEQNDVFAGKRHGMLLVVSAKDGEILSEQNLRSPPVFNCMIVADGMLFIADTKGRVVCYE